MTLIAFELLVAALTFAVAANVAPFRHSAISGPIASVFLAPCLLMVMVPLILRRIFIMRAGLSSWAIYGLVVVLVFAASIVLAKAAALACRAVFEFLPPWMSTKLGLNRNLLVRSAIVIGGSLSLLVVLVVFGWLSIALNHHMFWAVITGGTGIMAAIACIRGLLCVQTPELFRPSPLPESIKKMIFRENLPTD